MGERKGGRNIDLFNCFYPFFMILFFLLVSPDLHIQRRCLSLRRSRRGRGSKRGEQEGCERNAARAYLGMTQRLLEDIEGICGATQHGGKDEESALRIAGHMGFEGRGTGHAPPPPASAARGGSPAPKHTFMSMTCCPQTKGGGGARYRRAE